ncbi:MAG TPA: methylmalonyl Co-A mutase-associated GTPase MeaB [Ignavibacteria bacterium]|nr:methylmalonyl Co-A mutase-associated GTPase MeaB [Ignavibacteria bacterium]
MIDNLLIEKLLNKERRAIARSISIVELNNSTSVELLEKIHPNVGRAYRIGVTGPPGAGKSSITNQLTKYYLKQNKTIGIIAVDPSSPFTGGALLGDRIRMTEIGQNPNVFIRSMASRGSLGGLSKKAIDAADVIDAAGYDYIIFETVGVGQSELDIANAADTTIVVLVPESGDYVQAMKAGLMEIADFFVLNKSDRPGAQQATTALTTILMLKDHDEYSWIPNIIQTIATENKGIDEIANEINRHHIYLKNSNNFIKNRELNIKRRIKDIVEENIQNLLWNNFSENLLNSTLEKVVAGDLSPYQLAEKIIYNFRNHL